MTDEELERIADKVAEKVVEEVSTTILDLPGHGLLLHFTEHALVGGALILNEERARANPCNCFQMEDGKTFCFAKGTIGLLSQEQMGSLCVAGKNYTVSPGLKERFKRFREAAEEAHETIKEIPKGERLAPWLSEMSKALKKQGINI